MLLFSIYLILQYKGLGLLKSANSLSYVREVQKLSAVLSNIGGLIGAVTAALFLLKLYTECSLEITIGLDLFHKDEDENPKKNINFLNILRLTFYRILKGFGWKGISEFSQRLNQYQKQAVKQLDVGLLLRRLIQLESSIIHLLPAQQIQKIWEKEPITIDNAKKMRSFVSKEQTNQDQNIQSPRVDSECIEKSEVIFKIPKTLIQNNEQLRSNIGLSSINKNIVEIEDLQCSDTGRMKDKKYQSPKDKLEFRGILINPKQRESENKIKNFLELYQWSSNNILKNDKAVILLYNKICLFISGLYKIQYPILIIFFPFFLSLFADFQGLMSTFNQVFTMFQAPKQF